MTDALQGILGFSEGAVAAASVILEEKRLWEEEGIPRQLQVSEGETGPVTYI